MSDPIPHRAPGGAQPRDELGEAPVAVPAEDTAELYEHAPCGHLSALPDGLIIRLNETLLSWTGYRREDLVGRRRFPDLLTAGGRIYHETHYAPLLAMQGSIREIALELVCADGSRLPVLLSSVAGHADDGTPVVRTSVFQARDRRAYEQELLRARQRAEESEARARRLAQTLQASLIPPETPSIPGLEVGAAYRPAGDGDEVGGDFYDVFQVGEDSWGVVLGDVCGKGAAAAAVTALGRYTVRAAAMRAARPSEVLATLNATLRVREVDGDEGERFCTALYLQVRTAGERVEVRLASGGHPLPLRVNAAGVDVVGEPGSLLGVLAEPELRDATVMLEPGDGLFCFTDGLIEARRGDELFGDHRLAELVASHRSLPAAQIPWAVVADLVEFQAGVPRDDMAAVLIAVPAT